MLSEQVPLSLFLFYIRVGSNKNPGIIVMDRHSTVYILYTDKKENQIFFIYKEI
jgi:hypothetical protein